MRYGVIIFIVTAFLIANTYTDGKYVAILKSWKNTIKWQVLHLLGFLHMLILENSLKNPRVFCSPPME